MFKFISQGKQQCRQTPRGPDGDPVQTQRRGPAAWAASSFGLLITLLGLAGCSGLSLVNAVTPTWGYQRTSGVAYGKFARQRLDVYRPTSPAPANGYPVMVFFYGGSWREGSRADYRFVAQALAQAGVLTVLPDYRVYPEADWRGILRDSAAATAWALRQATALGGNPARVFVAGHSAGAYNAAMLALDRDWLNAEGADPGQLAGWVGLSGPYDFSPIKNPEVIPVFGGTHPPMVSQPIHHVAGAAPLPALLMSTPNDELVDAKRNTHGLAQALRKEGTKVEEISLPPVGHAGTVAAFAWPLRDSAPVLPLLLDWLNRHPEQPSALAAVAPALP